MSPQLAITATDNNQDGNLNESSSNVFTSGPHGRRYYTGINYMPYMTDSINPDAVSLRSAAFYFQ